MDIRKKYGNLFFYLGSARDVMIIVVGNEH